MEYDYELERELQEAQALEDIYETQVMKMAALKCCVEF